MFASLILPVVWIVGSGVLVACAQPDISAWACMGASIFGYALFWRGLVSIGSWKGRFGVALIWFMGVEAVHFDWLLNDRYMGGWIYPLWALLLFWIAFQFAGWCCSWGEPRQWGMRTLLGWAGVWVFLEWSRLLVLTGFGWDPVGLPATRLTPLAHCLPFLGIYGLSFWVMLTNLAVFRWLCTPTRRGGYGALACIALPFVLGGGHLGVQTQQLAKLPTSYVNALLVQPALYPEEKIPIDGSQPYSPLVQWHHILSLLAPHRGTTHAVLVLPEAVVPYGTHLPLYPKEWVEEAFTYFFGSAAALPVVDSAYVGNGYWAQGLANLFEADVIAGFEDYDGEGVSGQAYNAALFFRPEATWGQRYAKRILLPMAEYIPFAWCKRLLASYGITDSFTPGKEHALFYGSSATYLPTICSEEIYGGRLCPGRREGANFLVNLSNDAWYPRSRLSAVHFWHGRVRALEQGAPLVRACNTGTTCGVDSLGRVVQQLIPEAHAQPAPAGVLAVSVPHYHYKTLYTLFGDYGVLSLALASICIWAFTWSLPKSFKYLLTECTKMQRYTKYHK